MDLALALSSISLLIAGLAAIYARSSANAAKKANDIARVNMLRELRGYYLSQMQQQESLVDILRHSPSGMQAIHNKYAELDTKLRAINTELEQTQQSIGNT